MAILKPSPSLPSMLASRHFDVLEDQFHGLGGADTHFVFFFAEGEARHSFFEDEGGDAFHAFALVGHGENNIGFGFAAVGDEDFAAVQ